MRSIFYFCGGDLFIYSYEHQYYLEVFVVLEEAAIGNCLLQCSCYPLGILIAAFCFAN